MKKHLLMSGTLAAVCALSMSAKTELYMPDPDMFYGTTTIGKVSENGRFVVVFDDDNKISFLWDKENPTEWIQIDKGEARLKGVAVHGVSNDGKTLVGTLELIGAGNENTRAAYMRDGSWHVLPTHPKLLNMVEVQGCNADASIIFGYQFINDPASEIAGRFYPCTWTLNEEGEYDMHCFTDIQLPDHQGFVPWCMSEDGSMIAGTLFVPAGSTIPALVWDGELVYFDEIETRMEEFYYKDELLGIYENFYINGYNDGIKGDDYFEGSFTGIDPWGNLYGHRTRAFDVVTDPDDKDYGKGTLVHGATVWNSTDSKWTDFEQFQAFSTGLDGKYIFTNGGMVTDLNGNAEQITNRFDFDSDATNPSITHVSGDGKTLAGIHSVFNVAIGESDYFPFVLVLDEPLVELPDNGITIVNGDDNINIVLTPGRVDVCGAENVTLFDLNGRLIGSGTTFHVAAGVYVVAAGNKSYKVLVK